MVKSYCQFITKFFAVLLLSSAWFFHIGVLAVATVLVFAIYSHNSSGVKNKQKRGSAMGCFGACASLMFFVSLVMWPITHYIIDLLPDSNILSNFLSIISEYSAYVLINSSTLVPPEEFLADRYIIARVAWLGLFCGVMCVNGVNEVISILFLRKRYVIIFSILITPIIFVFGPIFILPSYDGDIIAQSLSFVVGTWLFVCLFVCVLYWLNVVKITILGEAQNVPI